MRSELVRQGLRFGVTGAFITALHVLIAVLLIESFAFSPPVANGVAFTVATCVSYLVNSVWSFSSSLALHGLLKFFSVSVVGLALSVGISFFIDRAGYSYWLGLACVIAVVPPATFLLHRLWTYRKPR